MSVEVTGPDGKTYQFPDGTDKAAAVSYFKKKGIGAQHGAGGSWEPAPLRERLSAVTKPTGAPNVQDVANVGGGFLAPLLHPIDTLKSVAQMAASGFNDPTPIPGTRRLAPIARPDVGDMAQQLHDNPRGTLENMAGQVALAEGVGEVAPRLIPKGEASPSSPRLVKKLVEDTRESNKVTGEKNAKAVESHKQDTVAADAENARLAKEHEQATSVVNAENETKRAKYRDDTRAAAAENEANQDKHQAESARIERLKQAAKEQETHQGRLSRQIKESSSRLVTRVRDIQTKAKGKIDAQWNDLRAKVGDAEVPRDQLSDLVKNAESKLSGSSENIKVFRDILSKGDEQSVKLGGAAAGVMDSSHPLYQQLVESGAIEKAKPATFKDLQGYYSELGEKLSSGSLPGDVYQAIKSLQDGIDGMMQRVAAERGQGAALNSARAAYRDYMQTFRDISGPNHSGSPIAEALAAKDPEYAISPLLRDETAARVRSSLVRFGDDVHGAAAIMDNLRSQVRDFDNIKPTSIPKAPAPPKVTEGPAYPSLKARPELKTVPPPKPPEIAPRKTLGAEDITQAKKGEYEKTVSGITRYGHKMSVVLPMLYLAHDLVKLNIPNIPEAVGGAAVGYAGTTALTNFLERPAVVDFFTKATPQDIAQIPNDLRGDIPKLVKAAEQKGITVSPALKQLTVGAMGIAPRKHPSDEYAGH